MIKPFSLDWSVLQAVDICTELWYYKKDTHVHFSHFENDPFQTFIFVVKYAVSLKFLLFLSLKLDNAATRNSNPKLIK